MRRSRATRRNLAIECTVVFLLYAVPAEVPAQAIQNLGLAAIGVWTGDDNLPGSAVFSDEGTRYLPRLHAPLQGP